MTIAIADDSGPELCDEYWDEERGQEFWSLSGLDIANLIKNESPRERPDVLDFGCGQGGNAVAFARCGFRVTAADQSLTAIAHTREWAASEGLYLRTASCDFTRDFFLAESYDIILAVNSMYHGIRSSFIKSLSTIHRWLKPKGLFYFTCPTARDGLYGKGLEIEPDTFEYSPGHLHVHANEKEIRNLLQGFKIRSLRRHEHRWYESETDSIQFSSRWQVLAEKA